MSSRQEEKAQRRAAREEQERAAAAKAGRAKRLQLAVGALLAVAAVAAIIVVVTSGGSDSGGATVDSPKAAIPKPGDNARNLTAAAKAASCKVITSPSEGRTHTTKKVVYKTNPPSSGNHNPVPAEDGLYAPGNEPAVENWVHTLEHGRILIQYAPGTVKSVIDQLETVGSESFNGTPGYHVAVFENNTKMPYKVAAVAWTHILGCDAMNPQVFDAIRAFRAQYTDKAPELIQ